MVATDLPSVFLEASHGLDANELPRMCVAVRPHSHPDVEINFVERGLVTYLMGGRVWELGPQQLAVFWAAVPHGIIKNAPDTYGYWVSIPLAWILRAGFPQSFVGQILQGRPIVDPDPGSDIASLDQALIPRWKSRLKTGDDEDRRIVLLEIEARFRHLAKATAHQTDAAPASVPAMRLARIIDYISRHYLGSLSVGAIADEFRMHPKSLMRQFKRACGIALWDYVLHMRVAHAQELLITTDLDIGAIGLHAGFGSPSRFYAAFGRICGQSPAAYRRQIGAIGVAELLRLSNARGDYPVRL